MSKGGGGDTRQITQTTAAPEYAQPFLEFGLSEAKNLYGNQPSYYPKQTTVGFSPESEMALQATRQKAITGSPFIGAVQNAVMQNLTGTNPLLNAAFQPAIQQVQAQASKAGRYGSGYQQGALASAMISLERCWPACSSVLPMLWPWRITVSTCCNGSGVGVVNRVTASVRQISVSSWRLQRLARRVAASW